MENEKKIDEMYDNLLKIADSTDPNNENSIKDAEKGLENLSESFNELEKEQKSDEEISDSNNTTERSNNINTETVMQSYNPETGEQTIMDDFSDASNISEKHFKSFTHDGSISIEDIMNSKDFKDINDAAKIASIIQRRLNGESFNYYDELPDSLKSEVAKIMMSIDYSKTNKKPFSKNYVAKMIIDEIVESYKKESLKNQELDLDTLLAGFDKDIEKMQNEFATDLGKIMMTFDEERKAEIDAGIKRCEEANNIEAANNLRKMKDTLDKAYNLTEFCEYCLHCKIKNNEFAKPHKVFDDFNYKYINHKNTINDIRSCPTILNRHLPNYTYNHKLILCLAFCKYCRNMSPDNIEEHTFMYYFIRNIIAIDRLNPKGIGYDTMDERSKKFYDEFTTNLSKCIDNLLERNPTLK